MCIRHACILHGSYCDEQEEDPYKIPLSEEQKEKLRALFERGAQAMKRNGWEIPKDFVFQPYEPRRDRHVCTDQCSKGGHVFEFTTSVDPVSPSPFDGMAKLVEEEMNKSLLEE